MKTNLRASAPLVALATALTLGLSACGSDSGSDSSGDTEGGGTIASQMIFGGPPEFKTRADGIPGLKKNYGVEFGKYTVTDVGGPVTVSSSSAARCTPPTCSPPTRPSRPTTSSSSRTPKSNFAAQNIVPIINKEKASDGVKTTLNDVRAS